jgi:Calcineurin-like phosphoesterase superfamily domain
VRVAALCDVHGNVHALEAVLADVGEVDVVLFGGDLASGPFPAETIEVARSLPHAVFVRGNVDVLPLQAMNTEADAAERRLERADAAIRASGHPRAIHLLDTRPSRAAALRLLSA